MASDLFKLIEAINRVGIQNISLLSRLTGMPKETIRYILRNRFPELGLRVEMLVDYARLGLERYFVVLKFSSDALEHATETLERMAKVAFLTYRSSLAFEPWHIAMFAVPVTLSDEFHAFLQQMIKTGILESMRTERLEWTRHPELKSKYHDFKSRKWKIDWGKMNPRDEPPPAISPMNEPTARPEIDAIDTLVIKELELNSWRNFTDISRKLGMNDRTIRWHYQNHVSPIISSYYVRWLPVAREEMTKVIDLVCEFHNLSRSRLGEVRSLFNAFPFTWYEGGRSDGYYQVHSGVPAEHLVDSLRFLKENLKETVSDWKIHALDGSLSATDSYTVPYENFDDKNGWFFEPEKALNAVLFARAPAENNRIGP